jgi:hypothetical protein
MFYNIISLVFALNEFESLSRCVIFVSNEDMQVDPLHLFKVALQLLAGNSRAKKCHRRHAATDNDTLTFCIATVGASLPS